ncbi:hypothetical protein [Alterisphingorhabdus coralli]|uniref:Uncharacterized protein n=1 Tax=Alterisphingorhabdus coralli TaxID=3071408 RepID=A0AA97FAN0_9SPHN|nr:hypothetical protein [Parasphingorhabdus sp. SCSIO 66989]WOE76357.1 hypothetical protein RB602_06490 [Parasphingorhabdus sp. SCSIO 66989]
MDKLIDGHLASQAAEWARQYPQRQPLPDCAMGDEDDEFTQEAQEWEDAALDDEAIYATIDIYHSQGTVTIEASFTDEINTLVSAEYHRDIEAQEFAAMTDKALDSLIEEVAEAPYKEIESEVA